MARDFFVCASAARARANENPLANQSPRTYIVFTVGNGRELIQAPTAERDVRSRLQRKESAMVSYHRSKADEYRRKAETCVRLAACARSETDCRQFLVMREACLDLAANEEWLGDLPPPPPANANALRAVHP